MLSRIFFEESHAQAKHGRFVGGWGSVRVARHDTAASTAKDKEINNARSCSVRPARRALRGKLGTIFARGGHEVVFSYARSNDKLKKRARDAQGNARAGTPGEAAREADALLLAVHWSRVDDVLKQAGALSGKVIVGCSLPMNDDNTELVVAHTSSGAEALANKVPEARFVCAFNTGPSFLASSRPAAKPAGPASCTAGTMRSAKGLPLS